MKLETVAIDSLSLDPANLRKHSARNLDAIGASLRRFGQQKPIVVNEQNVVLAGNGTLTAARAIGWKEIKIVRSELAGTQATAFGIADNRSAELAEWDDNLADVLASLKAEDFPLSDIGFDEADLKELVKEPEPSDTDAEPQIDKAEELRAKWGVEVGQIWQLGEHLLMCGDSTKVDDVRKLMGSLKANMVFTDPPYGVSYKDSLGRSIQNDELTDSDLQEFLHKAFACGVDVSATDCAWYVWHADRFTTEFVAALKDAGLKIRQQIVWVKGEGREGTAEVNAPAIGGAHFRFLHEPCWYASLGKPFNAGDRKTTTVWTVTRPTRGTIHPTQKPVELVSIALKNSSQTNSIILDLFGGSGSTMMACEQLSRKCRAMELSPIYVAASIQRWVDATGKEPKKL